MCSLNAISKLKYNIFQFFSLFHMQVPVFNSSAFTSLNCFTIPVDWYLTMSPLPMPLPLPLPLIPAPYPVATPVSVWPLMPRPLWGAGLLAARSLPWSALMEKSWILTRYMTLNPSCSRNWCTRSIACTYVPYSRKYWWELNLAVDSMSPKSLLQE